MLQFAEKVKLLKNRHFGKEASLRQKGIMYEMKESLINAIVGCPWIHD